MVALLGTHDVFSLRADSHPDVSPMTPQAINPRRNVLTMSCRISLFLLGKH